MTYPPTLSYCVWLVVHIHDHRLLAGMQHDQYILFFLNLMYCPSIPKVLLLIVSSIIRLALLLFYHGLLFGLFRNYSFLVDNPNLNRIQCIFVLYTFNIISHSSLVFFLFHSRFLFASPFVLCLPRLLRSILFGTLLSIVVTLFML